MMPTRIIAIGLGGLGYATLDCLGSLEEFEVVAGADIADEPRERFSEEFGAPAYESIETALAKHGDGADAAAITTPHALHTEHVLTCFEYGLHVHVEKPLTVGIEDATRLVDEAEQRDLVLQVGYQRHFHPGFREVKRLIDAGRIGDIRSITAYLSQPWLAATEGWRGNPEMSGGGQLYDSGSHLLDAVLWLTDSKPRTVTAVIDNWGYDVDITSSVSAMLESENGRPVTASIGVSGDGTLFEEGLFIWGTEGHIEYSAGSLTVHEQDGEPHSAEISVKGEGDDFKILMERKLSAFQASVETGADVEVPGEQGLQVIALTEAAYEAARNERHVDAQRLVEDARKQRIVSD
ncbi:Gfo/Idh/MocA family protein [Haloprofundus salilacus]|uniref:Gfo/Idh/MocA family protein n=1 Tax=Haloprofundus salilacus TaxID=2876190 RepID=UPI001CC992FE|nr:Gfo/Idh/MocA family oxidoreductase [Haloprofundus salilacus]